MTATIPTQNRRLPAAETHVTDRESAVTFTFQGKTYTAYEGDTIASALAAAGVTTFSRSFKYHRRRGLLCASGNCPNCLVQVGDEPSVRSCVTPVADGMNVEAQNVTPSLDMDVMSLTQRVDRFLPAGFYYKAFMRPRALWPLYERVLRMAAGLGQVNEQAEPKYHDKIYKHADVAVIGGGPAGMRAALSAAAAGARVILLEEADALGGHLRYSRELVEGQPGYTYAAELAAQVTAAEQIEVMLNTNAFGHYDHNWIGAVQERRLVKLRARAVVNAAGSVEIPPLFHNNDLPGVMLASGVRRLLHLWGVKPGNRAVVAAANRRGLQTALDLLNAGVAVAIVADYRADLPDEDLVIKLRERGVEVRPNTRITAAHGDDHIEAVELQASSGQKSRHTCDLLVLGTALMPNYGLMYQAGVRYRWDDDLAEFVPGQELANVFPAGEVNATHTLPDVEREGMLAGLQAAGVAGKNVDSAKIAQLQQDTSEAQAARAPWSSYEINDAGGKKQFVCYCEDVTRVDVKDSIAEGYNSMELLKRYSTISMGPCQGRMCNMNAMHLCAHENEQPITDTGTTTSRPPARPVSLGALGGRLMEPVRLTPLHSWHAANGAKFMNAGLWKRPEHYGDPHAEVRAVREGVGIIDVSTLGKFHLHGADVGAMLERLYTNRWRKLKTGRVRYGVMTNDEGVIMDDGVTARLADDLYYMTATSGGAGRLYEWIESWQQSGWTYDVHLINATGLRAAVNVAGPKSRELLQKLCDDIDLNNEAFPYMRARQGTVAGAPAVVMRIGFTGELSYEIHVPSGYARHLWEALIRAGEPLGIQPFGVEAQRVLRLEKAHIIVGQDTDGLTNPIEAGMGWAVKLEKEDFFGKPMLARAQQNGPSQKLCGFEMPDFTLPEEANQIVRPGDGPIGLEIIGRVTSARYSPTLKKVIGLCWLPTKMAEPGQTFTVRVRGELKTGHVVETPFFDPQGERLRS